jgi:hypothetical protein
MQLALHHSCEAAHPFMLRMWKMSGGCMRSWTPPHPSRSPPAWLQGVPALALSLDNHTARREEEYKLSASVSVDLIRVSE